jgi:hypothetical protein
VQKQNKDVFINCPFDSNFADNLSAIVFAVLHSGFNPRTALEIDNASEYRLDKIISLIVKCHYAIHDISMIELDKATRLPRFNMPFECGLFYGIAKYVKNKKALILEKAQFDLKKCLTDLNGVDPRSHNNETLLIIRSVRNWLNTSEKKFDITSATIINDRYINYKKELPNICKGLNLDHKDLDYVDLVKVITGYIKAII